MILRALRRTAIVATIVGCGAPSASPPPPPSPTPPARPEAAADPPAEPEADEPLPTYVSRPDAPYVPTNPRPPSQVQGPTPEDEKECKARGGKIQPVCMMGALECIVRNRDAGKRCTDKRDCVGHCLYEGPQPAPANATGVCQRTNDPCGCHARVMGGKVQPTICTD